MATSTASFGAGKRESHDSSAYYARRMAAISRRPEKTGVVVDAPAAAVNHIFAHSSEKMDELPDGTVALMVTSPPYNVGKDYDDDLSLDEYLGCSLFCKCENLQRTGAFKFRGASNAVKLLEESGIQGDVATHSSGNHGAALALAARLSGRTAHVVMPSNSSALKVEAVRGFGGEVHFCEPTHESRRAGLEKLVAKGHIPVHPYDEAAIIAGQGTAALELEQDVPELEQLVTPLGGGGLISGTVIASRAWGVDVFGVEPEGAADTVASLEAGRIVDDYRPDTIADGLRAGVGVRNFALMQRYVDTIVTVSEEAIVEAMRLQWTRMKTVVEPSGAVAFAGVLEHGERFRGRRAALVVTGGNVDIDRLPW